MASGTAESSELQGQTEWILLILRVNCFRGVRRIQDKKETAKEASVGASLALGRFLKKASPQLGFPNIILLIRQNPVPRQLLLKIREMKTVF